MQRTQYRQNYFEPEKQSVWSPSHYLSRLIKATVFKTMCYWSKDGRVDKESSEICPHMYGQMIFNKDDTVI